MRTVRGGDPAQYHRKVPFLEPRELWQPALPVAAPSRDERAAVARPGRLEEHPAVPIRMKVSRSSLLPVAAALAAGLVFPSLPSLAQEASPAPSSGGPTSGPPPLRLSTEQAQVTASHPVDLTLAHPGEGAGTVELFAHNRGDRYVQRIRSVQVDSATEATTFRVYPDQHKAFSASHTPTDGTDGRGSNGVDVAVRAAVSIDAVRNGVRDYTFQGGVRPAASGTLASLYRIPSNGIPVLTARARTDSAGRYSIRRLFSGSGRFGFFVRAAATSINDAGDSRTRPTLVY